ncbi:hypothetical protein N665_1150s0005 [Sinapis alba]|nr:hypothetical protein N665_1150s0004 [Sinapis alba]KAF8068131.1 hypothetical protein N665_1150s0005 [Sinapis alba]
MAKSLLIKMLVSIVVFFTSHPSFSQEIDQYSQQEPKNVNLSSPIEALENSPVVKYERDLMHHYSHKRLEFLHVCLEKMNSDCGNKIFKNMLDETKKQILTNECCLHLLNIGKDCHLGLAQIILSIFEYKDIATMAIPKNKHTWNDCVRRVGSEAGTQVSLEE